MFQAGRASRLSPSSFPLERFEPLKVRDRRDACPTSLRLQLREQVHVADAFLAEEHHAQAVNANADAARRRHSVFERDEEIFVQLLLLAAGLMFQRGALREGFSKSLRLSILSISAKNDFLNSATEAMFPRM